jgi:hypothetical protein
MTVVRAAQTVFAAVMLCATATGAFAQLPPAGPSAPSTSAAPARPWSFGASVNTYFVPEERNFGQPIVSADRSRLHLEARYNYEALDTGSLWLGVNFSGGETVEWEITPMFGGVVGDTSGVAPGYKGSLTWRKLEFYSEGEYVFDSGDSSENFFYNWSELSWAFVDWFRVGLVTQRTRVYQTERDIQRGLLVGFAYKKISATTYVFNPDDAKPTVILGVSVRF